MQRLLALVVILVLATGCQIVRNPDGTTVIRPGLGRPSSGTAEGNQTAATNPNARETTAGTNPATPTQVSDDPARALQEVFTYLSTRGYRQLGPAQRRSLAPNAMITFTFPIRSQRCYTAVVIGAVDSRFGLQLLSQERVVSSGGGGRAFAEICTAPGSRGGLRTRIQHVSGPTDYYLAVFETNRQTISQLATILSAQQTADATLEPDAATSQRMASLLQRLDEDGYRVAGATRGQSMSADAEPRDFELDLREGLCYAFATFGGPGARDTGLRVFTPSDQRVREDTSRGVDAVVTDICPSTSGRYRLQATLYAGSTNAPVFITSYQRTAPGSSAEPEPSEAGSNNVVASQSTAGQGLEENFAERHASNLRGGYEPLSEARSHELASESHRDFPINLEGGSCYAVLAVGDNRVRKLDLVLLDSRGRELDRDYDATTEAMVRVCPSSNVELTVRVQMTEGEGRFIYSTYQWGSGTQGAWGLQGLMYVRHAERTRLLDSEGYESDLSNSPQRGSLRAPGRSSSHNIQLAANQCYTVIAVGDASIQDLNLELFHGRESLVTDESVSASPELRYCTESAGRHRVTISAERGRGAYFLQLYRRRPNEESSP